MLKMNKICVLILTMVVSLQCVFANTTRTIEAAGEKPEIINFILGDEIRTQQFFTDEDAMPFLPKSVVATVKEVDGSYSFIDVPVNWGYYPATALVGGGKIDGFDIKKPTSPYGPHKYYPIIDESGSFKKSDYDFAANVLEVFEETGEWAANNTFIQAYVSEATQSTAVFDASVSNSLATAGENNVVATDTEITLEVYDGSTKVGEAIISPISGKYLDKVKVSLVPEEGYRYEEGSIKYTNGAGTASIKPGRTGTNEFYMLVGAADFALSAVNFIPQTVPPQVLVAVDYSKFNGYAYDDNAEVLELNTVINIDNGNGDVTKQTLTADTHLNNPTRTGYVFNGYIFIKESNTFVAQWLNDGGDDPVGEQNGPEDNDNLPNIYQTVINYHIVNGTWGTSVEPTISKVATFLEKNAPSGEVAIWPSKLVDHQTIDTPTNMTPVLGAIDGSWEGSIIPETEFIREDHAGKELNYTFAYTSTTKTLTYTGQDEHKELVPGSTITVQIGKEVYIDLAEGVGSSLTIGTQPAITIDNATTAHAIVEDATLSDPTRNGYTFIGFVYSETTSTLKAQWQANNYNVHFESNGGTPIESIVVPFDTLVTKPNSPSLANFEFVGWYTDIGLTTEFNFTTTKMPANDITLYAKYTPIIHDLIYPGVAPTPGETLPTVTEKIPDGTKVTINNDNGTPEEEKTIIENTTITAPSKEGNTFLGYEYDEATKSLTAQWQVNNYNVHYESNGGTVIDSQSVKFGASIIEPAMPTKANSVFVGWYIDANLTQKFDFQTETMPAHDITLFAMYEANQTAPDTGDNTITVLWAGVFAFATLGMIGLRKKRQ